MPPKKLGPKDLSKNERALEDAIENGDLGRVQAVIAAEPRLLNACAFSNYGAVMTPMHIAVSSHRRHTEEDPWDLSIAQWLADQGADANANVVAPDCVATTLKYWTPLHCACYSRNSDAVKWLLEQGVPAVTARTYYDDGLYDGVKGWPPAPREPGRRVLPLGPKPSFWTAERGPWYGYGWKCSKIEALLYAAEALDADIARVEKVHATKPKV